MNLGRFIIICIIFFFRFCWLPLADAIIGQTQRKKKTKKTEKKSVWSMAMLRARTLGKIFYFALSFHRFPWTFAKHFRVENSLDLFCWNRFNAIVVKLDVCREVFPIFIHFIFIFVAVFFFFGSLVFCAILKLIPSRKSTNQTKKQKLSKWIQIMSKL